MQNLRRFGASSVRKSQSTTYETVELNLLWQESLEVKDGHHNDYFKNSALNRLTYWLELSYQFLTSTIR